MIKNCLECERGKQMSEQLLQKSDSVFDAVYDFCEWTKSCKCENNNLKEVENVDVQRDEFMY